MPRERFRILETWPGGQGETSLVTDRASGALRVLKIFAHEADRREASLLASLVHPRIPRVLETGRGEDGRAWLVREHVEGESLARDLPLSAAETAELAVQLLEILGYVHLRGVLHLDLKPANVLRRGPRARPEYVLLDFGLGTRGGAAGAGGTPFFAAPEVLLGLEPDARSDLFSLGALLVAALHGEAGLPLQRFVNRFPSEDFFAALGVAPDALPLELRGIVTRLVAREPAERHPDAQAALDALRGGGSGRPVESVLDPDPIACYGGLLESAIADGTRALSVGGGDAATRQALAIHAVAMFAVRAEASSAAVRLVPARAAAGAADLALELPALTEGQLAAHLRTALSLASAAAGRAATALYAAGARQPSAIGARLRALVESGAIVPHGPRWVWPDAEAGRPLLARHASVPAEAEAIRAAARHGDLEAARGAYRRGALAGNERELRAALAEGLLEGGEPGQVLPLAHDLPLVRAKALLDLGRVEEARQLAAAADAEAAPRERLRLALGLAVARADHAEAERLATQLAAESEEPQDQIALAYVLARRGQADRAEQILTSQLARVGAERPFLRAVALSNLGEILRGRGEARAARDAHGEAKEIFMALGHVRHVATATMNVGVLHKDLGELAHALESHRKAHALFLHVGDQRMAAITRGNLGAVALASGDVETAERELAAAEAELVRLGAREYLPRLTELLASARAERAAPAAVQRHGTGDDAAWMNEPSEQAQRQAGISREVFRTFLAVNRRLAAEVDLERAMRSLLEAALNLTGGRNGYLLVARQECLALELRAGDVGAAAVAFSRSLAHRAIQLRRTMTSAEAALDKSLLEMPSVRDLRTRSAICVPFLSAAGMEGALYVDHPGRAGVFDDADKEHLEILADQAAIAVDRMLHEQRIRKELGESRHELAVARRLSRTEAPRMFGKSKAMQELFRQVDRVARSALAVLVTGATGTGKELVARRIHEVSERRRGPFVSENCSAIPAELMESELFGHMKGAFTGADDDRPGLLEVASGGTLFLDEVGDMPLLLQPKLLRALQEGQVRRIGGKDPVAVDLRLVAATHKDLRKMIADGLFREDLFFRIAAVQIHVPSLAQRGASDIMLLAQEFLARLNKQHQRAVALTPRARGVLESYPWPGNVRELEHVIARAFLLNDGDELDEMHLPALARDAAHARGADAGTGPGAWPVLTLAEAEARTIQAALAHTNGDKTKAAKVLGISRTALYEKLKRIGG